MNDMKRAIGTAWHIAPIAYLVLACGEAASTPRTAESAQDVQQAADESATDPQRESTTDDSATPAEDDVADSAGLTACDVPSDSGEGASCHAGRELLRCTSPSGGAICIGEADSRCEGTDASFTCESVCEPDEYAASCGSTTPGGGGAQPPAEACRSLFPTPGGVVYYCCPCSS